MFGKKKQPVTNYDDKLQAAKYDCVLQALNEICKLEIKSTDANGLATAVSTIKTRARLALDFVKNLEKHDDD